MPLPSIYCDDFEKAGRAKEGPARARIEEWEFIAPKEGAKGLGQYRCTFRIFERLDEPGLDEQVSDSFWLDGASLWKLRALAEACGLTYKGKIDWADVANDCLSRDCWINVKNVEVKGAWYARVTNFGSSLAELTTAAKKTDDSPRSKL